VHNQQIIVDCGVNMINKLVYKNFHSFNGEQEISFEVGKKPATSYYDINLDSGERLNKVLAVVGANGAGKTQMLRPLAFLGSFISNSAFDYKPNSKIALMPHLLHKELPTDFELYFILGGEQYRYHLSVTREAVLLESLYKKTSSNYSYVFVREKSEDGYNYKHKGFGFSVSQAANVRSNVSIISAASQQNVSNAAEFYHYFESFMFNVNMQGRRHYNDGDLLEAARFVKADDALKERLHQAVFDFDLGINDITYLPQKIIDENGEEVEVDFPFAFHQCDKGEFTLPLFDESSGTKALFVMLRRVLPVLQNGGFAILDEIDNDLHPHMLPVILDWFKHKETNPYDAQIIFTCHTPEVLNILKKHQIYLVEKEALSSDAWRLDEMVGIRADDNLYAKYQAGALGAVPNI